MGRAWELQQAMAYPRVALTFIIRLLAIILSSLLVIHQLIVFCDQRREKTSVAHRRPKMQE